MKLQYFGHLMRRTDSFEKTLSGMLGPGRFPDLDGGRSKWLPYLLWEVRERFQGKISDSDIFGGRIQHWSCYLQINLHSTGP